MDDPNKNYTDTKDPNVKMGKHGVPITRAEFEHANANGYAWKDFDAYADYTGAWAKPITNQTTHPYYRTYGGTPNIPGSDVAILQAKYAEDPTVQKILNRNIARPDEVPMYGPDDADAIRALINREKVTSMDSNRPDFGLSQAVAAVKK